MFCFHYFQMNLSTSFVLMPSTGALMALLHWDAELCQNNGGFNPERPESQRTGLVWSSGTAGLNDRIAHHVPAGQRLWTV